MNRSFKLAASMIAATLALSGVAAMAGQIDPVHIRSDDGTVGNGARFMVGEKCLLVTAEHVIRSTSLPNVTPMQSIEERATVTKADKLLDIGLAVQENAVARKCPPLPTDADINNAIRGKEKEVWYVNSSGEARPFEVKRTAVSDKEIELQIVPNPDNPSAPRAFNPGMSGALVVIDGVPVAILKTAEADKVITTATRLDYIRSQYAPYFNVVPAPARPAKTYAPYSVDQLPPGFRAVVLAARETKRKSEKAESEALAVKRDATNAMYRAQQYEKRTATNGYAHFDNRAGDSYYAGEIDLQGQTMRPQGLGVLEIISGDYIGSKIYCRRVVEKDCQGTGVITYEDNKGNTGKLATWTGTVNGTNAEGYGHLVWQATEDVDAKEAWMNINTPDPAAGIWKFKDGRLYEGQVKGKLNGTGVMWDKDGKVSYMGEWKDGTFVK